MLKFIQNLNLDLQDLFLGVTTFFIILYRGPFQNFYQNRGQDQTHGHESRGIKMILRTTIILPPEYRSWKQGIRWSYSWSYCYLESYSWLEKTYASASWIEKRAMGHLK